MEVRLLKSATKGGGDSAVLSSQEYNSWKYILYKKKQIHIVT